MPLQWAILLQRGNCRKVGMEMLLGLLPPWMPSSRRLEVQMLGVPSREQRTHQRQRMVFRRQTLRRTRELRLLLRLEAVWQEMVKICRPPLAAEIQSIYVSRQMLLGPRVPPGELAPKGMFRQRQSDVLLLLTV